jgi:hypothetical protein
MVAKLPVSSGCQGAKLARGDAQSAPFPCGFELTHSKQRGAGFSPTPEFPEIAEAIEFMAAIKATGAQL